MLFCFALVVSVSYVSLRAAEKNRVETTMRADLLQLSQQMDDEYYTLVQMSQQMTTQGIIGKQMDLYLSAKEHFSRISLASDIGTAINTMIFSHERVSLVTYLVPNEQNEPTTSLFSNMPIHPSVDPRDYPVVMSTSYLSMQTIHTSLNQLTDKQSISLIRPVLFSNGETKLIYVESYTDSLSNLQEFTAIRKIPYFLMIFDEGGGMIYNTQPVTEQLKPYLSSIEFDANGVGKTGSFYCVAAPGKFGFTYLLLVPASHYNRQLLDWQLNIAIIFFIMLALVISTVSLMIYLIYRPLQTLSKDMDEVGKGNLISAKRTFHMQEFDSLFQRFDAMKQEVFVLMENARSQEKEKQQLEIDKLYYQINPHFLMNALNSVHWMAVANHQTEIDRFIYQLNYILSYSLGKTDQRATFRTELKSLELYLELQKERYDFTAWYEVEPGNYMDYCCARLILQPLAENAVCHNMNEFGNLWIYMGRVDDRVSIVIKDDGCGFDVEELTATQSLSSRQVTKGIGLRYVQLALLSFYGDAAQITIESKKGIGTTVRLSMPVQQK